MSRYWMALLWSLLGFAAPCQGQQSGGPLIGTPAGAASGPLISETGTALITVRLDSPGSGAPTAATGGSLFGGTAGASLLAPPPPRRKKPGRTGPPCPAASEAENLRHLIARAEAGRMGYDAVQHGARQRPPRPPTQMTLAEIDRWIRATPGQPHAIGRYQFIPATLRRLWRTLGLSGDTVFSAAVQDAMADLLLEEAGLGAFTVGELSQTGFMHNLARIWAGLPLPNGRSYYHGHAGNRATMSWPDFQHGMARIFGRSG